MNGYWVCYEIDGGELATWSDYAITADKFIEGLLKRENNIKRFTEFLVDEKRGKKVNPPERINISKYNRMIKKS